MPAIIVTIQMFLFTFAMGQESWNGSSDCFFPASPGERVYCQLCMGKPLDLIETHASFFDRTVYVKTPSTPPPYCLTWIQPFSRRDDYTYIPNIGGYKIHTRAALWNEGRRTCEEEGGHLAIVNSIAEANAIIELFRNSEAITGSPHPDFASIGFHDLYNEGEYVTIHGQSLARAGYTRWILPVNGGPDHSGGVENCGSIHKSGVLNDISCGTKFGFICEIPIY